MTDIHKGECEPSEVAAMLASAEPRALLAVARKLHRRSADHAAVLHDVLYRVASRARPGRAPARRVRRGDARNGHRRAAGSLRERLHSFQATHTD